MLVCVLGDNPNVVQSHPLGIDLACGFLHRIAVHEASRRLVARCAVS